MLGSFDITVVLSGNATKQETQKVQELWRSGEQNVLYHPTTF